MWSVNVKVAVSTCVFVAVSVSSFQVPPSVIKVPYHKVPTTNSEWLNQRCLIGWTSKSVIANGCVSHGCWYSRGTKSYSSTVVHMGLRSFILNRVQPDDRDGSNKDKDGARIGHFEEERIMSSQDNGANNTEEDADVAEDADMGEGDGVEGRRNKMKHDDETEESIEHRITRFKAGGMTNEEKEAYLKTALSRGSTLTPKEPPIRQKPPLDSTSVDSTSSLASSGIRSSSPSVTPESDKQVSPSPFPSDSLWNTVIGVGTGDKTQEILDKSKAGKDDASSRNFNFKNSGDMNEAQKRAFYNMVTSPDRFKHYSATYNDSSSDEKRKETYSFPDFTDESYPDIGNTGSYKETIQPEQEATTSTPSSTLETLSSGLPNTDLASRLEQAALLQEKAAAEAKKKRDAERQLKEQKQQEALKKIRMEEEQKILQKQRDAISKIRAEEEAARIREEEKLKIVHERRRKLEETQDSYWAKQIEKERASKVEQMNPDERKRAEEDRFEQEAQQNLRQQVEQEQEQYRTVIREEERQREDPHESQILKEAAAEKNMLRQKSNVAIARAASTAKGDMNPSSEQTDFIQEQAQKMELLNQMKQRQAEQLSQLNSPLPSPDSTNKLAGVKPAIGTGMSESLTPSPALYVSAESVAYTPPPVPSPNPTSPPEAAPPTSKSASFPVSKKLTLPQQGQKNHGFPKIPVVNWGALGKQKSNDVRKEKEVQRTASSPPPPSPVTGPDKNNTPSAPRLSLRDMTRYKAKENSSAKEESLPKVGDIKQQKQRSMNIPMNDTPKNQLSIRQTLPSMSKKTPIRQSLSFDDEEKKDTKPKGPIRMQIFDNDDDVNDNENEKHLTPKPKIPEDQIAKAKSWGINLDLL